MKFISSQLALFVQPGKLRRNVGYLLRFVALLTLMVAVYSIVFHYIMEQEGRSYSWITGVYWTLTVMSTLGFGDITFMSDIGRLFSIIVLLSGVIFLLVMLPFTFIQYFYAPWLEAQKKEHTPRRLPHGTRGHVLIVGVSPIILNLVDDLTRYDVRCVLMCGDSQTTLDLIDQGYEAVMGEYDNSASYQRLQVSDAAMVAALDNDVRNTNIVFTVREIDSKVPVTASVENEDSIDILELAGSTSVFQFHRILGEALARRVINESQRSSVLSQYGSLLVAEAPLMRTSLIGQSLRDSNLRDATGITVVGLWERGHFRLPGPETVFSDTSVAVVAGTETQVDAFNRLLDSGIIVEKEGPVVILGGGRVGLAAAGYLKAKQRDYVIVDKKVQLARHREPGILGDAADIDVLERAGIRTAPSVIITTHDDDTNIYLTIYCRRLRPDIQIISRATLDRNVGILHAAGADLVLSLASMMVNSILNLLAPGKLFMIDEGLNMFSFAVNERLSGKRLINSGIRDRSNCNVVAVQDIHSQMCVNPPPDYLFSDGEILFLIGDSHGEKAFFDTYDPQG